MESPRDGKSNLSKHLLQMKFMQRSALRVQKEDYESEQRKYVDDEHWKLDMAEIKQKESQYVLEPSFVFCEELKFGRMSFKGFNAEIEKLMVSTDRDLELARAEEREREIAVDDEEMAHRYETLVGTVRNKFGGKRNHNDEESDQEEVDDPIVIDNTKKTKYSVDNRNKSKSNRGKSKGENKRGRQGRYY